VEVLVTYLHEALPVHTRVMAAEMVAWVLLVDLMDVYLALGVRAEVALAVILERAVLALIAAMAPLVLVAEEVVEEHPLLLRLLEGTVVAVMFLGLVQMERAELQVIHLVTPLAEADQTEQVDLQGQLTQDCGVADLAPQVIQALGVQV
jgi:hypothetical protein